MLQQHKVEYRSPKLTVRAYTSVEDSGNTHDMSALGGRMANAQPGGIAGWFGTYLLSYFGRIPGLVNPIRYLLKYNGRCNGYLI